VNEFEDIIVFMIYVAYIVSAIIMTRNISSKVDELNKYLEVNTLEAVDKSITTAVTIRHMAILWLMHAMLAPVVLLLALVIQADIAVKTIYVLAIATTCGISLKESLQAIGFTHKVEALMELKKEVLKTYMKNTRK